MNITRHRALSLAIASLGDSARVLAAQNMSTFASEVREAADHLTALRDTEKPTLQANETEQRSTQNPS